MTQKTFSLTPKTQSTASTSALTVMSVRPAVTHIINSVHSRPIVTTALRYIVQIKIYS